MTTKELIEYVQRQLEAGVSESDVIKNLVASGWTDSDMKEAIVTAKRPPTTNSAPLAIDNSRTQIKSESLFKFSVGVIITAIILTIIEIYSYQMGFSCGFGGGGVICTIPFFITVYFYQILQTIPASIPISFVYVVAITVSVTINYVFACVVRALFIYKKFIPIVVFLTSLVLVFVATRYFTVIALNAKQRSSNVSDVSIPTYGNAIAQKYAVRCSQLNFDINERRHPQEESNLDMCIHKIALVDKNVETCNDISTDWSRQCKIDATIAVGDPKSCEQLITGGKYDKNICLFGIVENKKDVSLCASMDNAGYKDNCYAWYAINTMGGSQVCNFIGSDDIKNNCYQVTAQNSFDCENITSDTIGIERKMSCYQSIATKKKDSTLCAGILSENIDVKKEQDNCAESNNNSKCSQWFDLRSKVSTCVNFVRERGGR